MDYLLDTNIIIRHFASISKISQNAKSIIKHAENNEHRLIISVISLMEILYLSEKNRIPISLRETIAILKSKKCYSIFELNEQILFEAEYFPFYELHDRLILATARFLDIHIISTDRRFETLKGIKLIRG